MRELPGEILVTEQRRDLDVDAALFKKPFEKKEALACTCSETVILREYKYVHSGKPEVTRRQFMNYSGL